MVVVAAEPQAPEAVGGAGRARGKVLATVALAGVDDHDDNLGVVLGEGRGDDLLGAPSKMAWSVSLVKKMLVD